MLDLILPREISETIKTALENAGRREVGGVLLAEHVGPDEFAVREITVHRGSAIASFVRLIEDALARITSFFQHAGHDYRRFNYLGEWHSHPSFALEPSGKDDASMREIVQDPEVGVNFVALMIVKLNPSGILVANVFAYFPQGGKHQGRVTIKMDGGDSSFSQCVMSSLRSRRLMWPRESRHAEESKQPKLVATRRIRRTLAARRPFPARATPEQSAK